MIQFPSEFVATKYPGYFWNTTLNKLFTAKLGVLRELKYHGPNRWNRYVEGYRVCHEGERRTLTLKYLHSLKESDSTFPVLYNFVTDKDEEFTMKVPAGTKVMIRVG